MVTVLVEKREFGETIESASRPRRNAKTGIKAAASEPPPATTPSSAPAADASPSDAVTPGDRYRQISVFAYYKAEQRGFAPGHMWDDWLAAEREVDSRTSASSLPAPDSGRTGD
jgi:hypothetical protein